MLDRGKNEPGRDITSIINGNGIISVNLIKNLEKKEKSMPIVSLSFPKQLLDEMDAVQKTSGFTGRSELVRAAIRLMLVDNREKDSLAGEINGLIVVTHDEDEEAPVTKLKH